MSLMERLGGAKEGAEEQASVIFNGRGETVDQTVIEEEPDDPQFVSFKAQMQREITGELGSVQQIFGGEDQKEQQDRVKKFIRDYCESALEKNPMALPRSDRERLILAVTDDILGLGPIDPLLRDESVTEVMINGPKRIFVERTGKLRLSRAHFTDNAHLMRIIERILTPLGRRVDESSPMVDARLADGSRVNIIIPPLSLIGPVVTIRKFPKETMTVEKLVAYGTLSEDMAVFLRACIKARLNVLVSGGTGSGKTTTLNVLSSFIPDGDRIVTIEDAAELRLQQRHVVTLETRPANIEGKGQVTIRDLVRNALRMRPDRIVVGEVRAGEALDMLQAMNTGHDGSLTTAHANTPRDVLSRLETMVLMSGMELPVRAIRDQVSSAIDIIVHQSRIRDGSRKITYVTEVMGMEGNIIVTQDLFRWIQTGIDENGKSIGRHVSTGMQPTFMDKFKVQGIDLPANLFDRNVMRMEEKEEQYK